MKKLLLLLPLVILLGCQPIQNTARDGIAAAKGVLQTAQTKYMAQCTANPQDAPCVIIHKGVAAQNVAIDALEAYCEGGATPAFKDGGPCVANKAVEPKLRASLDNLNQIIPDVKGLL